MSGSRASWSTRAWALTLLLGLGAAGCGDEEELPAAAGRGVPGAKKKAAEKDASRAAAGPGRTTPAGVVQEGPALEEAPKRPSPTLDATSFVRRRDPFQGLVESEPVQPEPDPIRAERAVVLRQYSFEDLKLVAIANSRRSGVRPRALFVAGDGFSGAVRQGEHYSSAEVLLVAVNRDYVEIEVVDEELAASLGMRRGERRALYLRNE